MAGKRERVLLDANVMIPTLTNNVVLSVAHRRIFDPRWSPDILTEVRRHPPKDQDGNPVPPEYFDNRFEQMSRAFRRGEVRGYENLVQDMPAHPKDRHVLAAAVHGDCDVLLTENTKDFYLRPGESVGGASKPIRVERISSYLTQCLRDRPTDVEAGLDAMLGRNDRPPQDMPTLIEHMAQKPELHRFAHALNEAVADERKASPEALARAKEKRLGSSVALDGLEPAHNAVETKPAKSVAPPPRGSNPPLSSSRGDERTT